jgi:hypothetical protein
MIEYFFNLKTKWKGSQNPINQHARPSATLYNCVQTVEEAQRMGAVINEGYMRLKPLLYPCTIEFSLMCLTVNIQRWLSK